MMQLTSFLDRFGLNDRERQLVTALLGVVTMALVVGIPVGVQAWVWSSRESVDEIREAVSSIQKSRPKLRERQQQRDALKERYGTKAPALAGFIEQTASAQKLQVVDSVDRPEVPHGKKFTERATTVHFKKANMKPLAKFLESVESSGYPVLLSRFNLRKRTGDPDQYDVELTVSAYDKKESKKGASSAEGKEASP